MLDGKTDQILQTASKTNLLLTSKKLHLTLPKNFFGRKCDLAGPNMFIKKKPSSTQEMLFELKFAKKLKGQHFSISVSDVKFQRHNDWYDRHDLHLCPYRTLPFLVYIPFFLMKSLSQNYLQVYLPINR